MKKDQVQIGGTFVAKVSGQLARVRIDSENPHGGWDATNVSTRRKVRIKSAQRLRFEAGPPRPKAGEPPIETLVDPLDVARAETALVIGPQAIAEVEAERQAEASSEAEAEMALAKVDPDRCSTSRCKGEVALTHKGKPLCQRCWERVCQQDETAPADGAVTEDVADAAMASANDEENEMATKKTTKSKKTKATAKADAKAPAKTKVTAKAKAPAEKKPKRLSAIDAAAQVLAKAGKPMRSQELIEAMCETGLWKSPAGKTPHATLYAAMLREIAAKGKAAHFTKVDRGQFEFNGKAA